MVYIVALLQVFHCCLWHQVWELHMNNMELKTALLTQMTTTNSTEQACVVVPVYLHACYSVVQLLAVLW